MQKEFDGEIPYLIHIGGDRFTYDIEFPFLKATLIRTSSFVEMNEYLQQK
jgi:hypothetical protein